MDFCKNGLLQRYETVRFAYLITILQGRITGKVQTG